MTTAATFTVDLTDDALEAIAQRAAAILAERNRAPAESAGWLTVQQAADHLSCRPQRIYNLVSQRRLRHVKDGSRVLFRRQWLDDYLEAST